MSSDTPNTVGPPATVITIEEPITSDAVMMPIGRPIDRAVEAIAEAVEALEIEIDPHAAVPRVLDQPREVARH